MKGSLSRLMMALALVAMASSFANAQGSGKASLTGTVKDSSGAILPGVSVVIKNLATGQSQDGVTNASGAFAFPGLDPGKYSVSVSLTGFKTVDYKEIPLATGTANDLKVLMDVGAMTDKTEVTAGTDLVQTTNTTVQATISADLMSSLPLVTRNALNFVTFLPGVDTAASSHSQRASTIMGLPQSAIAISIDGVNVQDQVLKSSDGFFASIRPQTDLIEEVTVSEATPGADSSGQGAIQIKFVTRSGSNQHTGSVYEYYRSPWMNSNSPNNILFHGPGVADQPKNKITLNQYGVREGGPIVVPGLYDGHGKAFYFVNYEEFRLPSTINRSRTYMSAPALLGNYNWGGTCANGACANTTNVLALAAALNAANVNTVGWVPLTTTIDPTMKALFQSILTNIQGIGVPTVNSQGNTYSYAWQPSALRTEHLPGGRIDYNFTNKHKLTGTYAFQKVNSNPDTLNSADPRFPGFPIHGAQYSYRNSGSETVRSTFTKNLVNEASFGFLWSPVYFFGDIVPSEFANQGGFSLGMLSIGDGTPTSITASNGPQNRNGWNYNINDTVSWLKGNHSLQFGEQYTTVGSWLNFYNTVPGASMGISPNLDPASLQGMFTAACPAGVTYNCLAGGNLPGAAAADLTGMGNLYAMLTGRITGISGYAAKNPTSGIYEFLTNDHETVKEKEIGLFLQDTWRVLPNVTINAGIRWEVQLPFTSTNSVYSKNSFTDVCGLSGVGSNTTTYGQAEPTSTTATGARLVSAGGRGCNFLLPGTLSGTLPVYEQYTAADPGYKTDYNNYSPNVGVAWQPNVQHGWGRTLLGDPAQATVRASIGRTYNREGLNAYLPTLETNPGVTVDASRSVGNLNWPADGGAFPVLLSQTSRMVPLNTACPAGTPQSVITAGTCFALTATYPLPIIRGTGVNAFDPHMQVPYSNSWSVGFQRALGRDMAVEVRYVGTRNRQGLTSENWNEANVYTNAYGTSTSYLDEFKKAQANLFANIAAGKGNTFAYTGVAGTNPLPIYLAYFQGLNSTNAGDPTKYTATNFTNTTFVNTFSRFAPSPFTFAGNGTGTTSAGNATLAANAAAAGLPSNFFVMNPSVGTVSVLTSAAYTAYDSVVVDLRRRLSRGLQFDVNYTKSTRGGSALDSIYVDRRLSNSTAGVPQALKMIINYDVPVGRGKRYGANMAKWADQLIGGWSVNLTGRVQSGVVINYGDRQIFGMTQKEFQSVFKYYKGADGFWYDLPQDILAQTIKANAFSATTADGYNATSGAPSGRYIGPAGNSSLTCLAINTGDCNKETNLTIIAPMFTRFDMSLKKTFPFAKRANISLEVDVLNIFNAIDFNPNSGTSSTVSGDRVTSGYSDVNNTFDPGGRIGQLAFRVSW